MDRDYRSKLPPDDCGERWTGSSSNASSLTGDHWGDILRRSANDESPAWTDEKHSMYLEHLEVSFVNQLHKSMGSRARRDNHLSQLQTNFHGVSEQYGSARNSDSKRGDPSFPSPWMRDMRLQHTTFVERPESEGTGQNFMDEDTKSNSTSKSHVKRKKNRR